MQTLIKLGHSFTTWWLTGDWKPTFEGVATLVVGTLGFLAVVWQIRSSYKTFNRQLETEARARSEERERQKRAIATVILYEIDNFYMIELELVEKNLAGWDGANDHLPTAVGFRANTAEIYKAVSPILGSLNAKSVSAIVKFYSMVGSYEGQWRDYQYCLDKLWLPGTPPVISEAFAKGAKEQLEGIRKMIPELKKLAANVSNSVAQDCGLDGLIGRTDAKKN
jgi:hypothetical protein